MKTESCQFEWSVLLPIHTPPLTSRQFPRRSWIKWNICFEEDKSISLKLAVSPIGKIITEYSGLLNIYDVHNKLLYKVTFSDEFEFNYEPWDTNSNCSKTLFQHAVVKNYEQYKVSGTMDLYIDITATIDTEEDTSTLDENQSNERINVKQLLNTILSDVDFFDISLKVKDTELRAHKIILAAASPVLKAALAADMLEKNSGCIIVNEFDVEAMQLLIAFIYNNSIEIPNLRLGLELLKTSNYYDIPNLGNFCVKYLLSHINENSALKILTAAVVSNAKYLQEKAMDYFANNPRIYKPSEFKSLLKINPKIFLVMLSNVFKAYTKCKYKNL